MNQLAAQLRRSNRLGAPQLETAFRRQQIYGGSLDTVLLELELLGARELIEELSAMSGLPAAPVDLLSARIPRPWDALPSDLVDLGWVMPLGERDGRLHVVCHPDLPDERLADLRRAVDNVRPTIAPECLLARLAGERTESVVPQRYAVLSVRVLQDLQPKTGGAAASSTPEPAPTPPRSQAAAPWLSGPASRAATPIASVPPPPTVRTTPEPPRESVPSPAPRPPRRPPTWNDEAARATTMPPTVDDDEESFAGVLDDDDEKPFTPEPDAPGGRLRERTAPAAAPPPAVYNPPVARPAGDAPQPRLAERTGPLAAAPPVRVPSMLRPGPPDPAAPVEVAVDESAFATAQARLEAATERDQITQALLDAAAVLSPRAALFSVRRDGLHVLHASDGLDIDRETVITVGAQVEDALANARPLEQVRDLDLRLAVGLERPDPCLFEPVTVRERAVLVLYVDREGAAFDAADRERARALCAMASRGLEALLARRVSTRSDPPAPGSTASPATPPTSVAPAAPPPPVSTAPTQAGSGATRPSPLLAPPPTTSPARPASSTAPPNTGEPSRDKSDSIPKLVAAPPTHRSNTLTGHERPPAAVFKPPPSSKSTAPPLADGPLTKPPVRFAPPPASTQPRTDAAAADGPVDPMKITLVSGGAPPVRPPPNRTSAPEPDPSPRPDTTTKGPIVALSQPLSQPTTRGRLALDDEDVETTGQYDLGSESLTAKIDKSLDRVMRDLTAPDELGQFGDAALLRIAATFPGPLDVIRRDIDALPPPSAHGPLLRLCIRIGRPMSLYLIELMDHPNQALRFFSAFVFQELRDPRCMPALVERAFDPDADVRTVAMRVLETYARAPGYAEVVARVREELGSDNVTRQIHAARAAGTLRDTSATAPLIDALTSRDRYLQEAALESLCSITGQQLGLKAHRWRAWFGEHQSEHRVEWIISSLSHKDVSVRRWAGDELRRITGQPFVFPAAGDRTQRDGAIRQWREWWDREGRARMTGQNG